MTFVYDIYNTYLAFSVKDPTENPIVTARTTEPTDEQTTATTSTPSETTATPDTGKTQAGSKLRQSQPASTGTACYFVFGSI